MDTKKLRQKILDLAIRGKLVPQDPNDEPASVLLERIRAEKEQLIKEGKIKRAKKAAASDKSHYENVPFEVPEGWCWTTIGELFQLQAGKFIEAPQISTCKDATHIYPCYGGNGLRGYVESYNRDGLFPIIGRQGALCGNINIAEGKFYATEHAVVVETFANIDIQLFVYFLIQLNLNQYATATAQPGLAVKTINEVPIPLPPINEQHRISMAIEKSLDTLSEIDQSKHAISKSILQLKSRILDLAISGKLATQDCSDEPALELLRRINPSFAPCDNRHYRQLPDSWEICQLKDIFDITMGQSPAGDTINGKSGIEFHQGKLNFTEKYLSESGQYTTAPSKVAVPESLLLCVRAPVGIVNITKREICIGRGLCSLRPKYDIDCLFWLYMLSTLKDYFDENATGSTFKAISGEIIRNATIPFPPVPEQKRILLKINELFYFLDKITAVL